MASIKETLALILDEFSIFSDPRDKYVYLVDLAKDSK
ncbi:MAG: SufE family protein, partial [Fidelibacterota bacterium]